jgi:hypothetical protein
MQEVPIGFGYGETPGSNAAYQQPTSAANQLLECASSRHCYQRPSRVLRIVYTIDKGEGVIKGTDFLNPAMSNT